MPTVELKGTLRKNSSMMFWNLQIQNRDWICAAERRDFLKWEGHGKWQLYDFGSLYALPSISMGQTLGVPKTPLGVLNS